MSRCSAPLLLASTSEGLALADPTSADFALVQVRNYRHSSYPEVCRTRVRGEACTALMLPYNESTLVYAVLTYCTEATPALSLAAGASLLARRPLIDYASDQKRLALEESFDVDEEVKVGADVLKEIISVTTGRKKELSHSWKRSRVTGEHHTLIRPTEAVSAVRGTGRLKMVAAMYQRLKEYDETEAFASGVLVWSAVADVRLVSLVVRSRKIWLAGGTVYDWMKAAKAVTADLKIHQHFTSLPLEQMFELHVLANRGLGTVDWDGERYNRTKPNTVKVPPGEIYDIAKRIFLVGQAQGYKYHSESWANFWCRRWASTPTGSVHSQYSADGAYISKDRMERNKQFTVISMPDKGVRGWLARQPEIQAWPSVKYEWAKNRAIYGTDLTSYLLTDFSMPAVEEALSAQFPVGSRSNEKYVSERVKLAAGAGIAMCFDYEDFNSQHTLQSMYEVVTAYRDAFSGSMNSEQKAAIEWVCMSVLNQRVNASPQQAAYKLRGTLLSGWRLTTLVNTVLNKAYLEFAGCTEHFTDSVHNGDDVLAYAHSVKDAVEVLRKTTEAGIRAQPDKCTIGGIQEFLRVDRAAERPTGSQYLSRACATAVHARAEANEAASLYQAVRSQMTRLSEMQERGADVDYCDRLQRGYEEYVADVFKTPVSTVSVMKSTHVVHGGMSNDEELVPRWRICSVADRDVSEKTVEMERKPGVIDYARYLSRVLNFEAALIPKAVSGIAGATAQATTLTRRALEMERIECTNVARNQQFLHKICENEYAVQAFTGKARLAGLPAGRLAMSNAMTMAAARIGISRDPIKTMSLIF